MIKINDKTISKLVLPEIVYNIKKKLGCIFVKNHNLEFIQLKRQQPIGLVKSCVVTQEEQGQTLVELSDAMQRVTERSNDTETSIGGPSVGDMEKAGQRGQCGVHRK